MKIYQNQRKIIIVFAILQCVLGNLGVDPDHPPKMCAGLGSAGLSRRTSTRTVSTASWPVLGLLSTPALPRRTGAVRCRIETLSSTNGLQLSNRGHGQRRLFDSLYRQRSTTRKIERGAHRKRSKHTPYTALPEII